MLVLLLVACDFCTNTSDIACGLTLLPQQYDRDDDEIFDADDVDMDNDGLIEIASLEQLANIQNELAGTSYDDTDGVDTNGESVYDCGERSTSKGSICGAPKKASKDLSRR